MPEKDGLQWTGERFVTMHSGTPVLEHLHRYSLAAGFVAGKTVLDMASGEGYGSNLLALHASSVTGVDVSGEAVAHASAKYKRKNLSYVCGSADKIPLQDSSFDVAVSFETLEHLTQQDAMLSEIKRVLKKDGLLIMSTPDRMNCSDKPGFNNIYHVKELYLEEFRALIKRHFKHHCMLMQKIVFSSIIAPEKNVDAYGEYNGNFEKTAHESKMGAAKFNIVIASDKPVSAGEVSVFTGDMDHESVHMDPAGIRKSVSYRLGYALTMPLRLVKNVFKMLKNRK